MSSPAAKDGGGVATHPEHHDAYLYGEGDLARGAKFLPPTASDQQKIRKGREISQRFTRGLPALGKLQEVCKAKTKKNGGPGYLIMPDGRRTYIRHEHAALNSLLQAAGAVICKAWIVEFNRRLTEKYGQQGWSGQWAALLWAHDEVQLAVRPAIAEDVGQILVASIRHITEHFQWKVALSGEYKIGNSWKATH